MNLTTQEIDTAELSILLLFRTHLAELDVEQKDFNARQVEALKRAKQRMLDRWDDQIKFKQNQLVRKH